MTVTGRKELQDPRFARQYLRIASVADRRGGSDHRRRLLDGLSGRVLEVGAGPGRDVHHHPATVEEVVALEPDDTLRTAAEKAAASAPVHCGAAAPEAVTQPAPEAPIRAAGFTITDIDRFGFSFSALAPNTLHILAATRS